jgi:endonuclease YncB( thermonuclease family)
MSRATIKATFILFALCLSATAQQQTITGKVVGVSDGDTITMLDEHKRQHKIRHDGIDAPDCEGARLFRHCRKRPEASSDGNGADHRLSQQQYLPFAELPGLLKGVGA